MVRNGGKPYTGEPYVRFEAAVPGVTPWSDSTKAKCSELFRIVAVIRPEAKPRAQRGQSEAESFKKYFSFSLSDRLSSAFINLIF